jgi:hypothetical protein
MKSTLDFIKERIREEIKIELDLTLFELVERLEDELLVAEGKNSVPKL